MISRINETIAKHFREGTMEWLTAKDLSRRYGGTRDHIKRVAEKLVETGLAVKREGKKGSEYSSQQKER